MSSKPLHERWTKVFEGSMVNAKIVQNELEGEGIPAVVPESSLGTTEVNMVGIRSTDGCVYVAPDRAQEARDLLERRMPPLGQDEPT